MSAARASPDRCPSIGSSSVATSYRASSTRAVASLRASRRNEIAARDTVWAGRPDSWIGERTVLAFGLRNCRVLRRVQVRTCYSHVDEPQPSGKPMHLHAAGPVRRRYLNPVEPREPDAIRTSFEPTGRDGGVTSY